MRPKTSDKTCLSYWFPKLAASGVLVPPTRIVTTEDELVVLDDGETPPHWTTFLAGLRNAADEVGGYPVFLRTGHGSGKHDWLETCFVPFPEVFGQHVYAIVVWSNIVDMMGLPTNVWAVRKMLPMLSTFTAFGGFPVNKERRYFIESGKVRCHHPYWPPYSIDGHTAEPDWQAKLAALNEETPDEVALLTRLSEQVARAFDGDGAWSLDWAQTRDGDWYAIDMAEMHRSYHWPNCPAQRPA